MNTLNNSSATGVFMQLFDNTISTFPSTFNSELYNLDEQGLLPKFQVWSDETNGFVELTAGELNANQMTQVVDSRLNELRQSMSISGLNDTAIAAMMEPYLRDVRNSILGTELARINQTRSRDNLNTALQSVTSQLNLIRAANGNETSEQRGVLKQYIINYFAVADDFNSRYGNDLNKSPQDLADELIKLITESSDPDTLQAMLMDLSGAGDPEDGLKLTWRDGSQQTLAQKFPTVFNGATGTAWTEVGSGGERISRADSVQELSFENRLLETKVAPGTLTAVPPYTEDNGNVIVNPQHQGFLTGDIATYMKENGLGSWEDIPVDVQESFISQADAKGVNRNDFLSIVRGMTAYQTQEELETHITSILHSGEINTAAGSSMMTRDHLINLGLPPDNAFLSKAWKEATGTDLVITPGNIDPVNLANGQEIIETTVFSYTTNIGPGHIVLTEELYNVALYNTQLRLIELGDGSWDAGEIFEEEARRVAGIFNSIQETGNAVDIKALVRTDLSERHKAEYPGLDYERYFGNRQDPETWILDANGDADKVLPSRIRDVTGRELYTSKAEFERALHTQRNQDGSVQLNLNQITNIRENVSTTGDFSRDTILLYAVDDKNALDEINKEINRLNTLHADDQNWERLEPIEIDPNALSQRLSPSSIRDLLSSVDPDTKPSDLNITFSRKVEVAYDNSIAAMEGLVWRPGFANNNYMLNGLTSLDPSQLNVFNDGVERVGIYNMRKEDAVSICHELGIPYVETEWQGQGNPSVQLRVARLHLERIKNQTWNNSNIQATDGSSVLSRMVLHTWLTGQYITGEQVDSLRFQVPILGSFRLSGRVQPGNENLVNVFGGEDGVYAGTVFLQTVGDNKIGLDNDSGSYNPAGRTFPVEGQQFVYDEIINN